MSEFNKITSDNNEPVSLTTWIIVLIILAIPCVNVIAYLYLAFGNTNTNLKNFSRAGLIMMCIGLLLSFLIVFLGMIPIAASLPA